MITEEEGTIKGKLSQKISKLLRNISSSQRIRFVPHVNRTLKSRFMLELETLKIRQRNYKRVRRTQTGQSKKKNKESPTTSRFHWRLLHFLMQVFLRTILKSLHVRNKSEILNLKFKQLTTDQKIEILNMTS